jgi:hypothetical protein
MGRRLNEAGTCGLYDLAPEISTLIDGGWGNQASVML